MNCHLSMTKVTNIRQLQRWAGCWNYKICETFQFHWNLQPYKWKKIWHWQLNTKISTVQTIYLDLRASSGCTNKAEKLEKNDSKINLSILLKVAATKKLRLRVCAYSVGEYLYILSRNGLTLRHRNYTINSFHRCSST